MSKSQIVKSATLYVVATPIGNLADISQRARDVLQAVDLICAEDTRHTRQLLNHLNIQNDLRSLHEHNERERTTEIVELLKSGQSIALVSDAGTPAISDPGFVLVRDVRAEGFDVSPIPGCSAVIAALSAAGLATDRFIFDGFLPAKSAARQASYSRYLNEPRTAVVYESSHRIEASLRDLVEVLGGSRQIAIARELTKLFETILSGNADKLLEQVSVDANQRKGEFVIIIEGVTAVAVGDEEILRVLKPLLDELPPKQAAGLAAKITSCRKKAAYDLALKLKEGVDI